MGELTIQFHAQFEGKTFLSPSKYSKPILHCKTSYMLPVLSVKKENDRFFHCPIRMFSFFCIQLHCINFFTLLGHLSAHMRIIFVFWTLSFGRSVFCLFSNHRQMPKALESGMFCAQHDVQQLPYPKCRNKVVNNGLQHALWPACCWLLQRWIWR